MHLQWPPGHWNKGAPTAHQYRTLWCTPTPIFLLYWPLALTWTKPGIIYTCTEWHIQTTAPHQDFSRLTRGRALAHDWMSSQWRWNSAINFPFAWWATKMYTYVAVSIHSSHYYRLTQFGFGLRLISFYSSRSLLTLHPPISSPDSSWSHLWPPWS